MVGRHFFLALLAIWAVSGAEILQIHVATSRQLGEKVGSLTKEKINKRLAGSDFTHRLLPLLNTTEGKAAYAGLLKNTKELFPQIIEELEGMATGSGNSFRDIFLWNIRPEMVSVEVFDHKGGPLPYSQQCSDVYATTGDGVKTWGHNEDADLADKGLTSFVNVTVSELKQSFFAFVYAGTLAGNAFGFTPYYGFSTNAISPVGRLLNGETSPRYVLNREALNKGSRGDAMGVVAYYPCGSGFSSTYADVVSKGGPRSYITTIESSSHDAGLRHHMLETGEFHFNMYRYLNVSQKTDISSLHREARAKEYPLIQHYNVLVDFLGDTQDKQYPVYRNGAPPDDVATLATGVFTSDGKMTIFVGTNPRDSHPDMVLDLPFAP